MTKHMRSVEIYDIVLCSDIDFSWNQKDSECPTNVNGVHRFELALFPMSQEAGILYLYFRVNSLTMQKGILMMSCRQSLHFRLRNSWVIAQVWHNASISLPCKIWYCHTNWHFAWKEEIKLESSFIICWSRDLLGRALTLLELDGGRCKRLVYENLEVQANINFNSCSIRVKSICKCLVQV